MQRSSCYWVINKAKRPECFRVASEFDPNRICYCLEQNRFVPMQAKEYIEVEMRESTTEPL